MIKNKIVIGIVGGLISVSMCFAIYVSNDGNIGDNSNRDYSTNYSNSGTNSGNIGTNNTVNNNYYGEAQRKLDNNEYLISETTYLMPKPGFSIWFEYEKAPLNGDTVDGKDVSKDKLYPNEEVKVLKSVTDSHPQAGKMTFDYVVAENGKKGWIASTNQTYKKG